MRQVFQTLNNLKAECVVEDYAIGGGMALLFYTEPVFTYDIDVFIPAPAGQESAAVLDMSPLYRELRARGFESDAEHEMIHGVPGQFLVQPDALIREAMENSVKRVYEETPLQVLPPEHLAAVYLKTGGAARRERAAMLWESASFNRAEIMRILSRHQIEAPEWTRQHER